MPEPRGHLKNNDRARSARSLFLRTRYGSHLANLCRNSFTLRWKSVIAGLCQVRPQVFRFGKNFANRQNIKDAVVLGWGRQIFTKSSQTMGIIVIVFPHYNIVNQRWGIQCWRVMFQILEIILSLKQLTVQCYDV